MQKPLVSVIVPTFNRRDCILRTLESILNQTYDNIEVWIVDDGSADDTDLVVNSFITNYKGTKQIYYIIQNNAGAPTARNNGFKHSKGEYVIFFDSDDEMLPRRVELQVQSIQIENADACTAGYEIWRDGKKVGESYNYVWEGLSPLDNWLMFYVKGKGYLGGTQAWMYKRCVIEKIGGYDPILKRSQDLDLNFRVLTLPGIRISVVDEVVTKFNDDNRSDRIMKTVWKSEKAIESERKLMNKIINCEQVLSNSETFKRATFFYLRSYVKNALSCRGISWAFREFRNLFKCQLNVPFINKQFCQLYVTRIFLTTIIISLLMRFEKHKN